MSTIEKLFVQIFERKKQIIDQVKHQTDLFDQYLASKCLLDGIPPPAWLLSPSFPSFASDPNELKKEELLSGLLLRRPQPANLYSNSCYSLFQRPIDAVNNVGLPNGSCIEVHPLNRGIDACDRLSFLPQFGTSDAQCTLIGGSELDFSVTSPQNVRDAGESNNYPDHDRSLGRIQRSKSRQRALELRNSAKVGKTHSCEENNDGACGSQIVGSRIASLQYDNADKLELVKAVEANNENSIENVKIGKCKDNVNCNYPCHDRTSRSGSAGQQTRSVHEPGNLDSRFNIAKEGGITDSVNTSIQDPKHANELLERANLSYAVANAGCVAEEIKTGDWCNQTDSNFYLGRTRSKSYSANSSFEKQPLDIGMCSYIEGESRLTESIKRSAQQSNYVKESMKSVKPPSIVSSESCAMKKTKNEDNQIKERRSDIYCGRITRSRSSSQQLTSVNKRRKLDKDSSCAIAIDVISMPEQQPNHVGVLRELVKPFGITDKSCDMKAKVWDHQSSEEGNDICGTRTRFRNLKLDSSCGNGKEDGVSMPEQRPYHVDDLGELVKPFDIASNRREVKAKLWDSQSNEERNDTYCGRITRSRSSSQQLDNVDGFTKMDNSSNIVIDRVGALAESFGKSSQPHQPLSLVQGGVDLQVVLGGQENVLPCTESNVIVDVDRCDAVVAETDIDSDRLDEVCSVASGFNSVDASIGVGILVSNSPTECAMLVKPKQLDFDDVEECNLNETFDPPLENKPGTSSEKRLSSLLHSKDILDNVASIDYQEKPGSSIEMPLWEEQESSCQKEKSLKDSYKAHLKGCHVLADESTISPRQQKTSSGIFQNQNAVSYFNDSWSQNKRIKIGIEPSSSLYASSSLMAEPFQPIHGGEAVQPSVGKCPVEDLQLNVESRMVEESEFSSPKPQGEEVEPNLKERERSGSSKCEQQVSSVPSSTKPTVRDFQGCLLEKTEAADPASIAFGVRGQHTSDGNQVSLQLEDRFELGIAEPSSHNAKNVQEDKYHVRANGNVSYLSESPHRQSMDLVGSDQIMPEFEGFVMDTYDSKPCFAGERIDFDKFHLPNTALERASILEHLCRSACLDTPLSHFSTTFKLRETLNLHQSMSNGLLESMEMRTTLNMNDDDDGKQLEASYSCLNEEANSELHERSSDCPSFSNAQSGWDIKKPYVSPIGKLWDGITSKSGSSKKKTGSIPELPCISEENENVDEVVDACQKGISSELLTSSVKREPLADITKNANPPTSVCGTEIPGDRFSVASVNTDFNVSGTSNGAQQKPGNKNNNKRRYNSKGKENQHTSPGVIDAKRANESVHNRFTKPKLSRKTSLRKGGPSLSEKEPKRNNIVSHITSFVPLVQQKPAAAVITGKRDVKVKALETAEAAKRHAEKKENERKMRKEALKLERAKMEEKNLRQLELEKEKKEERKKKEADMAARKRQREEEERKEKERKKKRVEESRKQQLGHEEKLRAEKEIKSRAADVKAYERKESKDKSGKHEKKERTKADDKLSRLPETEPTSTRVSTTETRKESIVPEDCQALSECGDNSKVMRDFCKATESDNLISNVSQEQSYEISPYKGSDDEEEDDEGDDIPNSKFVPSWASKSHLALAVSSQQSVDPESIFSPESFYNIAEVLLPRRLQQNQQPQK